MAKISNVLNSVAIYGTSVSAGSSQVVVMDNTGLMGTAAATPGAVDSITGNTGGAISGAVNIVTANSTPIFAGAGQTETLDFNLTNLVLGSSLPALAGGIRNVGMGSAALSDITSGTQNVAIGFNAGKSITTATANIAIGAFTLDAFTTAGTGAEANIAVGGGVMHALTTGQLNVGVGQGVFQHLLTGTNNVGFGTLNGVAQPVGNTYTGAESNNLLINNVGVIGESNIMRIGTTGAGAGQVNKAFIAGAVGVTTDAADGIPLYISSTGQLGTAGNVSGSNSVIGANPTTLLCSTAAISYIGPWNSQLAATEANVQVASTGAFTASKLYVNISANTASNSNTVALRVNGVTTALTVSIGAGTTGVFSDTTHTVSIAQGDLIDWITSQATAGTISGNLSMNLNG